MRETNLDHPSLDRLRCFSQGRVSAAELSAIEAHLAACPDCCEALGLGSEPDPLLARMRKALVEEEVGTTERIPAFRALREGLAAKPEGADGDTQVRPGGSPLAPAVARGPHLIPGYDI